MDKLKRWSLYFLTAILCFSIGLIAHNLVVKRKVRFKVIQPEPPIAFQPDEQNKGRQCQAIYYGLGEGDGVYDPYCYDLQSKLSLAAGSGDVEKIKELLRSGANADSKAGDYIYPLQAAASKGHIDAVRLLLDNGADVNHWHPIRGSPLSSAVCGDQADVVELLLSRGADTRLKSDGYTPLKLARERGNQIIIALLERTGAER